MASAWDVSAVGWAMIVLGWWISPVITFFLPKIFTFFKFDVSQKVRELRIYIIPELEKTLRAVDQERMLDRANKPKSILSTLDEMAGMLKHTREDAEDIFDDAEEIELYRSRCWQRLCGAVKACILSQFGADPPRHDLPHFITSLDELAHRLGHRLSDTVATCKSSFMWLLQWARKIIALARSEDVLPMTTRSDAAADHTLLVTRSAVPSDELPAPVSASSDSSGTFLFFNLIKNGFGITVRFVYFLRDWPYHEVGITNNEENGGVFDYVYTATLRWNLKQIIEKVESTILEVNKSPLLGATSEGASKGIANKNRSKIRSASNRKVFGREALRDSIMAKFHEIPHGDASSMSTTPCYSVIGIYGVAGSGKTTFARYTRDYIKEQGLFDTVICIHVSDTFSVDDIFHEMLKDITKDSHSDILDREKLEEKVKESLCGKSFCLILDDLWIKTKNDPLLEQLIFPLNVGLKGSKILVTARTKVAAGALCDDEPLEMPDLDDDQYFSMFMHYALGGRSVANEEFSRVGRVIAEKLHQSPIAAVAVAGRLGANLDIKFWKSVANHGMLNDTMCALWWSYHPLNPDIRRCFEFCNIFPRRCKLGRDKLVHLWIAQGFVKTSDEAEDLEDVADGYIQELVSCSFLQPEGSSSDTDYFTIHDLLHDLLDSVTGTDCFRIENARSRRVEGWKGDVPPDVRHLFVRNYDGKLITEKIIRLKHLRTLIIYVVEEINIRVDEEIIKTICKMLPKLRILAFSFGYDYAAAVKEHYVLLFPEAIGLLKHLRYLSFKTFHNKVILPSTLSELRHIQLLDFGPGIDLDFRCAGLIKLRHIFCRSDVKYSNIGNLTSLQTLPGFTVRNEQGYEVKQLSDLNKLRGRMVIHGLENVKSKEEALETNLFAKELLIDVSLWWFSQDTKCSREVEAEVFEGLCPPVRLETLKIWGYNGSRYPDWMVGKQSGGPKELQVLHFNEIRQMGPSPQLEAFPRLRVLHLSFCWWKDLPCNMEHLTSLKELAITGCRNIRSLPTLPLFLEKFELFFCNDDFMKSCQTVGDPNWKKIEHIPKKTFR